MILPATFATTLLLAILSIICLGSWASTFKLTKKWRFELFYFDYAFGVAIAAFAVAFTFGSMGDELSFQDNLLITGKRHLALAFAAGGIFSLGNMLLVAAISLSGLTVAFPIGLGLALVIGVAWSYALRPVMNPVLLFGGAFLVMVAIAVDALAYRAHAESTKTAKAKFSTKGLIVSLISGLLMGSFYPLVQMSRATEVGLGPYTVAVVFSLGVVSTTLLLNLYFMNLPIHGQPIPISAYFAGKSIRNHALGLFGGIVWCLGAIANFVASSAPAEVNVNPLTGYALSSGAAVLSALWGLLVWKEFAGATSRVRLYLGIMFLLFAAGLTLVALAPLYRK